MLRGSDRLENSRYFWAPFIHGSMPACRTDHDPHVDIDHDPSYHFPRLPLREVVRDLDSTDPAQETCAPTRSFRFYGLPPRQHKLQQLK